MIQRFNEEAPVAATVDPTQLVAEVRDREACVYGCRMCINLHLMCISQP